ncbi:hypothetical protein M3J09_001473 [Ascochyta lentis]
MDSLTSSKFIGGSPYVAFPIQAICTTPEEVRKCAFAEADLSRLPGLHSAGTLGTQPHQGGKSREVLMTYTWPLSIGARS